MATLIFNCIVCGTLRINKKAEPSTRYCSQKCYHFDSKGKTSPRKGAKLTQETKEKLRIAHLKVNKIRGKENHPSYKKDRNRLSLQADRLTGQYNDWRKAVYKRDGYQCRLKNMECSGQIEAHHIFTWKESIPLRFEVSNGITLCHYHHPRGNKKEKLFQEKFKYLVNK